MAVNGGRGRPAPAPDLPELLNRFGGACPVCGAALGGEVPWDARRGRFTVPPCLRLEVGPTDHARRPSWRVTMIGGRFRPAVSVAPQFVEGEVDYVYLLCGDGHIFPDSIPINYRDGFSDARQRVDRWNMVAAVGALASGKTYLLLRMLNQDLDNPENWDPDHDVGRVRMHHLNPLEEIPLRTRSDAYAEMLASRRPIRPTQSEVAASPAGILGQELPDALDAIQDLIRRTVVDGDRRAAQWGKGFRQPLVVRTDSRGASHGPAQRTWTGIADLPGELFQADPVNPRERVKLRSYDALVWVIDPAVAAQTLDRFAKDTLGNQDYEDVLNGSLRPGTTAAEGQRKVRAVRDQIQLDIGRNLTLVGNEYAADQGGALQMLVAVSKCDLIHAVLRKGRHTLDDLGEPGAVGRGVAGYLAFASARWAERRFATDEASGKLLGYLHAASSADRKIRRERILQVAEGLLAHFSRHDRFWNLVHVGGSDQVDIPGGRTMAVQRCRIEVPTIGTHLDGATLPGSAGTLLARDLVMSALGAGVAYGLGHEAAIFKILREPWQNLRLFLCSPLRAVPRARQDHAPGTPAPVHLLEPLEPTEDFPMVRERSAALTQLMLAVLAKARARPGSGA